MPIQVNNLFYTYLPKSPIQTEALRGDFRNRKSFFLWHFRPNREW